MTISMESSSPAEMVTEHDTLRPEAETTKATPSAKSKPGRAKPRAKSSGKSSRKSSKKSRSASSKKSKARPPKKSKRALKKASPRSKGVRTTSRSGKKITRAKAGGKGILAAKGLYLLVVRVPEKVHAKVWRKAKAKGIPLNLWLNTLIAKAAS